METMQFKKTFKIKIIWKHQMLILATLVHKLKQNKQNFTHYASLIMIFFPQKTT